MELLDLIVVLFLILWGTSILFSIMSVLTYIAINSAQRFPFLHILTSTYLSDGNHSDRCEGTCPLPIFKSDCFYLLIFMSSFYIWDIDPFSNIWFGKYVPLFNRLAFNLVMVFFALPKLFKVFFLFFNYFTVARQYYTGWGKSSFAVVGPWNTVYSCIIMY